MRVDDLCQDEHVIYTSSPDFLCPLHHADPVFAFDALCHGVHHSESETFNYVPVCHLWSEDGAEEMKC